MKLYFKFKIKLIITVLVVVSCSTVKNFSEFEDVSGKLIQTGLASWYGPNFHGKLTASGDIFDMYEYTAAHNTLPFGSIVRIVNKLNGKSVIVKINDRGPFVKNRIIDLSRKAAEEIGLIQIGYTEVDVILLNQADLPENLKIPSYTVQIGSYLKYGDAERMINKIGNARIVKARIKGKEYFRVYVGIFLDKVKAESERIFLEEKGIEGFVKQIEN